MSNANAVAVATEGLKAILDRAFQETGDAGVTGAKAIAVRPTQIPTNFVGVNVFLYHVSPNASLRNEDLPTRRANGEFIRRPQIAVNLHYLLTFVGSDSELAPHRMLGAAVAGLHASPELTEQDIAEIANNAIPDDSYLKKHNDLAQQVERVRFTFETLSIEEISKLWALFPQKAYELSVAVQASVVLLEAPLTPVPSRPVLRRGIYSGMPGPPELAAVTPLLTARTVDGARAHLALTGANLSGDATRVRFDALDPSPAVSASRAQVVVQIPDELRAGIHAARILVAHTFSSGDNSRSFELESNALPFVLEPRITTPSPIPATVGSSITLTVEPPIAPRQRVRVILASVAVPWTTPLPGPGVPLEHATLTIALPAEVEAGRWPVRVEVDGATSTLVEPPAGAPPTEVASPYVEVT